MSTSRAITQLVKAYAAADLRLSAIEEEKAAVIASTNARYKTKEDDLLQKRSEAHSALMALGLTPDSIATAVKGLNAKPEEAADGSQ